MAIEIERKFLLANDGWRASALRSDHLIDGLITRNGAGKVRVRAVTCQGVSAGAELEVRVR